MQWKFRKDFQVMPGMYLTYGKNGIKTKLQTYNRSQKDGFEKEKLKYQIFKPFDAGHEIKSSSINTLTSTSLTDFKSLLLTSTQVFEETDRLFAENYKTKEEVSTKLRRLKKSLLKFLYKKRIKQTEDELELLNQKVDELQEQLKCSSVFLKIDSDDVFTESYKIIRKAFSLLSKSEKQWDFTSSRATNRIAERTSAANTVTRSVIQLSEKRLSILDTDEPPMCFHNMNGGDLYLYPGFMIIYDSNTEFAVVDYSEVNIKCNQTRFIESEVVPSDTKTVDYTWYKVNKDGTPDKRFASNYKIPIVIYGEIHFTSKLGLNEVFCFSNAESALLFYKAFFDYVDSLQKANNLLGHFY